MVILLPIMGVTKLLLTTPEIKDIIYRTFRLPMGSLLQRFSTRNTIVNLKTLK